MAAVKTNLVSVVIIPNAEDRKLEFVHSEFDADIYQVVEFGWETGEMVAVTPESDRETILATYYDVTAE